MNRQATLLGILGAVLVIALWWLFLYSPGQDDLQVVEDEIVSAETEQASLRQRVAALEGVRSRAPELEAAIAQLGSIVPDDPALSGALRQVGAAADDAGLSFDAFVTTRPAASEDDTSLYVATVNITASGSYFQLVDFLRRVEDPAITARGIEFTNLTVTTDEYPSLTINLSGEMYSVLDPVPTPPDPAAEAAPADEATEPDATATEAAGGDE